MSDNSLPLMGIGNRGFTNEGQPRTLLITPHGDREPRTLRAMRFSYRDSLPLMGIGNRPTIRALLGSLTLLITPHGDREPRPVRLGDLLAL